MTLNGISLRLTNHEAVVLFEWLAKLETMGTAAFQHPAEEKLLWTLQAQLESILVEPFAANYADIVADARRKVEAGEK